MTALTGLAFAPLVPVWLLGLLAVLSAAAAGLALWRRARGAWLRAVATAVLLVALANPRLVSEERQMLPDVAVVVVDESLSSAIGDRRAQAEAAAAALAERLGRQADLDVRIERVGPSRGRDEGTRLFGALDRVLADVPRRRLAGVVMITDGRVHDVPADRLTDLGAPVHVLLTGRPGERDRRLALTRTPGYALVGKTAKVSLIVEEPGAIGAAGVVIRVDGEPYVETRVPLNREAVVEVPVHHAGQTVVELEAAAGPAELTLANNRAAVGISGVRDRLKVLLVSGEPHAGERTWRNLLKADPAVDLVHFTILRPPDKDDRTPVRELALITFPVRELFEDKLGDFDLVVFDRYRRRGVLSSVYYQSLARYVREGGALLVSVGPEFGEPGGLADSPLADILPAAPDGPPVSQAFVPAVTDLGRRHPVTSALPGGDASPAAWGPWLRQTATVAHRGDTVLAGAGGRPLVVLDRVGEGRVAQVLSDTFWLWARGYRGGGPHDELLRRVAHWLMKEPDLEEEALTATITGDRLEVVRRSLAPPPATVAVTRPDGAVVEVPLADRGDGTAEATHGVDQPGVWRVADGRRAAIAAAGSLAPLELAEVASTPDLLAPVARATGGSIRYLGDKGEPPSVRRVATGATAAGGSWIGLPVRGDHVVTGVREVPLVAGLVLLLAGLGGFGWAWWREGR